MKKIYLMLMLAFVTSATVKAQELPCKAKHWNERCKERYKEDSDGNRHGKYIAYNEDGDVVSSGEYMHGNKQGNWFETEYSKVWGENRYEETARYYRWYENGIPMATKYGTPFTSKAEAVAAIQAEQEQIRQAKADAEARAEAYTRRMTEQWAKDAAETARISKLREPFSNLTEVTLADIVAAKEGGATDLNLSQVESFISFFDPENKEDVFNLDLGSTHARDYEVYKAAALNHILAKTAMDFRQVALKSTFQKIELVKVDNHIKEVVLGNISGIKFKDNAFLVNSRLGDKSTLYHITSGSTMKEVRPYSSNFATFSEEDKKHEILAIAGSYAWGADCFNGMELNRILTRAEWLKPENRKEAVGFLLDVFKLRGASLVCENGATDDKAVLYRTYVAYLLWFVDEKNSAKSLFAAARSNCSSIDRKGSSKWITGSYSDYLNKYFHDVFIRNTTSDKELNKLTLSQDKELTKFLKSL